MVGWPLKEFSHSIRELQIGSDATNLDFAMDSDLGLRCEQKDKLEDMRVVWDLELEAITLLWVVEVEREAGAEVEAE